MSIKKILVSQPRPTSEKSPYFDLERKFDVEIVFRQFIKVEGLSSKEFRQSKVNVPEYSAIILTARTAVDHFFRLCNELRYKVPDTLKYFCVSETVANYLQKYVIYRKRKIFYSETGTMDGLIPIIAKHNKETYLMPVSDVHNDKTVVLDNHKVKYVKAVMYRTVSNDFKPGEKFDYDMLVFFTPAGIKSYINNFPDYLERKVIIAAMGSTTLEEARNVGLKVDVTITPEAPSMASAIELYLKKARAEEEKEERKAAREAAKAEKLKETTKKDSKKAPAKKATAKPAPKKASAKKVAAKPAAKKAASVTSKAKAEAEKRSAAAKKAAATRKAKAEAEKAAAAKRSAAAKKAAETRKAKAEAAKKAEAEKAAAKKTTAKAAAKPAAKKAATKPVAKKAAPKPAAKKATAKPAAKKAAPKPAAKKATAKPAAKKATATKKKK